jgi:hypothetical protein
MSGYSNSSYSISGQEAAAEGEAVTAYKITLWCESGLPEGDLAAALERGELWDAATGIQYRIEQVT